MVWDSFFEGRNLGRIKNLLCGGNAAPRLRDMIALLEKVGTSKLLNSSVMGKSRSAWKVFAQAVPEQANMISCPAHPPNWKTTMAADSPLVSIIIPCYNTENYVEEAIKSALGQSYDPLEVIVIDDGSTDGSLDVIKSFDEQITWCTGENQGVSVARNRGIEIAEGGFVKFLDADDILPENAVETQVRQTREISHGRAIVFGDSRQIGPEGKVVGSHSFRRMKDGEDPIAYILKVNPNTPHPLHRRKFLKKIGGFDEDLPWAEDYDLHLRLQLLGISMKYRPANVLCVRQHEDDDRLTNRKTREFKENPWVPFERGRDREQKIREARQGNLSDAVSQHLAKGFWGAGRQVLKAGYPDVAKKYFDHARGLHSQPIASSSIVYHLAVQVLGPRNAEQLVEWVRRVKQRLP